MVRMWSIAARFLDRKGLGGAWRELIQCKAIVEENRLEPGGYVVHPQLDRFRRSNQLHEPHINHHFNYYLHTLYHEAKHARNYNYNTNFIGPHHPHGCTDCSSLTSTEHAVFPLNQQHAPTMYHIQTPHFYTPNKYRYTLHYPDTILRDNAATCPSFRDLYTELSPTLLKTPRNVVEFSNTNMMSENTQRIILLEPIPVSPFSVLSPEYATLSGNNKTQLHSIINTNSSTAASKNESVVPIFSTSSSLLDSSSATMSSIPTTSSFAFKIGRVLSSPHPSTTSSTTPASSSRKSVPTSTRSKKKKTEDSTPSNSDSDEQTVVSSSKTVASSRKVVRESTSIEDTSLYVFSIPKDINTPVLSSPYTITWPKLQSQLSALLSTHSPVLPNQSTFSQHLESLYPVQPVKNLTSLQPATGVNKNTLKINNIPSNTSSEFPSSSIIPDIQHQQLPHIPHGSTTSLPTSSSSSTTTTSKKSNPLHQSIMGHWNSMPISYKSIPVTLGQVLYEWKHLLSRMENDGRDPDHSRLLQSIYIDINYHTQTNETSSKPKTNKNSTNQFQMDKKLLVSYNSPSFLPHDQITDESQLYIEKHPYVTQFDSYGLPPWLDIHHPDHKTELKKFNNVPKSLVGVTLDTTIPGFHPVIAGSAVDGLHDEGDNKPKKRKITTSAATLPSDDTNSSLSTPDVQFDSTPQATKKQRKSGAKKTSKKDETDSGDEFVLSEVSDASPKQTKRGANTRLSKSDSNSTLYTSQKSSLSQIKPVSKLPPDAKVLHINDIIHPMFYVVDGDIEYTEVVGEYDLGELKLFRGM